MDIKVYFSLAFLNFLKFLIQIGLQYQHIQNTFFPPPKNTAVQ